MLQNYFKYWIIEIVTLATKLSRAIYFNEDVQINIVITGAKPFRRLVDRCWQYSINIGQIKSDFIFHKLCVSMAYYIVYSR